MRPWDADHHQVPAPRVEEEMAEEEETLNCVDADSVRDAAKSASSAPISRLRSITKMSI
jgi:hypothetical protein